MIQTDILERLAGLGVPVLLPERAREPHEWQEETPDGDLLDGGRVGLTVYLEQHAPDGYVQIEQPFSAPADDYVLTWLQPVAAVAQTPERARELSEQIRRTLCGTPEDPGAYSREMADPLRVDPSGFSITRNTYSILEIDGDLAT